MKHRAGATTLALLAASTATTAAWSQPAASPSATAATPAGAVTPAPAASVKPAATPAPAASAGKAASPAAQTGTSSPGASVTASPATTATGTASATSAAPATPTATAPPAQPIIVNVTQPPAPAPEPASNSWGPGLIGLALLGTLGFFGWRYAKQRGLTVAGGLQQLGVEMPQDGVNTAGQVQPLRPTPPPAPPLPSLADLPAATSAPAAGFASSAPTVSGPPRLVAVSGPMSGGTFEIGPGVTIGRDLDNPVPLAHDSTVSRRHARIEPLPGGGYQVTDLGSSNGTFVNGTRITGGRTLTPGDQIQVGASRLRFEA